MSNEGKSVSEVIVNVGRLAIDGLPVELCADYSLRWVDCPGRPAEPELYFRGRRVVKAWSISLQAERVADRYGGNADTQ